MLTNLAFEELVIHHLTAIRTELDIISAKISRSTAAVEETTDIPNIPCTTFEELEALNAWLKDKSNYKILVIGITNFN